MLSRNQATDFRVSVGETVASRGSASMTELMLEACLATKVWTHPDPAHPVVSIALTYEDAVRGEFAHDLERALLQAGAAPHQLELSFPEADLLRPSFLPRRLLEQLDYWGVRLAVREFGANVGSLGIFDRWPLATVHLDASFARRLAQPLVAPHYPAAAVHGVTAVAEDLEVAVVATGVLNAEVSACLRALGCKLQQGSMFCPAAHDSKLSRPELRNEALVAPDSPSTLKN